MQFVCVCVCVCMKMYLCVCTSVCMFVCLLVRVFVCAFVNVLYVCINICDNLCTCVWALEDLCACVLMMLHGGDSCLRVREMASQHGEWLDTCMYPQSPLHPLLALKSLLDLSPLP